MRIFIIIFFFSILISSHSKSEILKKDLKHEISMIDFILFKIETQIKFNKQKLLKNQYVATRIQYERMLSKIFLSEDQDKIIIQVKGLMNRDRYKKKKYFPKEGDCNILKNLIFFERYGYNVFNYKKSNKFNEPEMKRFFIDNFLNNIYINDSKKKEITDKVFVEILIIHPNSVKNIFCKGKVINEIKKSKK